MILLNISINLCTILVIVQTCFQNHIYMCKVSKVLYRNHMISILDNCSVFFPLILMSYTVVLILVVKNRHLVERVSLQRYILCRKVFQVDRVVLLLSHIWSKAAQRVEHLFHIKFCSFVFFLTVITWAVEEKLLEPKKTSKEHKG